MKKLIIIFFFLLFTPSIYAEEITEIRLITDEWPGYTQKNGSGLYFDILKEIYEAKDIKLNIKLVPWALAKEYAVELADAIVGASMFDNIDGMRPSPRLLGVDYIFVAYKKNNDFKGINSFKGKVISWPSKYNFKQEIYLDDLDYEFWEINNLTSGMLMLSRGSLHYLLAHKNELIIAANEAFLDIKDFNVTEIFEEGITISFRDNDRGQDLMKIYEKGMKSLKKSGRLDEIYKAYGYDGYLE